MYIHIASYVTLQNNYGSVYFAARMAASKRLVERK